MEYSIHKDSQNEEDKAFEMTTPEKERQIVQPKHSAEKVLSVPKLQLGLVSKNLKNQAWNQTSTSVP